MSKLFKLFTPQDKKFQPLFEKVADNVQLISATLVEAVRANPAKRKNLIKTIEDLEHVGDDFTHSIFLELSKNFITPFDREDIHKLATAIDNIADYIHATAVRIEMYKIMEIQPAVIEMAEIVMSMCDDLQKAVYQLRDFKNIRIIADACIRINSGENKADYVFTHAVGEMFEREKDAIKLIKEKEILNMLEKASDMCEDAANVLETILVKNA